MKLLVALVTLSYVSQHALGVEVEVYEGEESVLLPCNVTVTDAQDNLVLWSLERPVDQIVHLRVQRGDKLEDQNQDYANRTSMRSEALRTGDLSLILKNPTPGDSDTYTCIYREAGRERSRQQVHLKVKERPTPPGVVAGVVLVPLLLLLAAAALGLWLYMKKDGGRVQQVEVDVEEEEEESVLLPLSWTDRWWLRMKMRRIRGDLSKDVRVEWTDGDNRKLHVFKDGSDQPEEQDQVYRDRTLMKKDLRTGDYSLKLKELTVTDRGVYACRVYNRDGVLLRQRRVNLKVKGKEVHEVDGGNGSTLLSFQTKADLPGDVRVEWTDRFYRKVHVCDNGSVEQELIYRGRTEMNEDRMETGDYSLTLKEPTTRDSGVYYCRIYSKDRDLLRETRVDLKVKVQQVEAKPGAESVLLSFQTTAGLPGDVRVEWTDKDNRKVHEYCNSSVQQDQVYRDRTEMNEDLMKDGDYSLVLKHPTVRDKGGYICRVYNKDGDLLRERRVELKVKVQQVEAESGAESVLLSFQTTADLPGDVRVEWTDRFHMKVHVYQNGSVEQDQVYRGRTEMNEDLMKTGDYSLILRKPRDSETGVYYCRVYTEDGVLLRGTRVYLKVKGKTKPSTPGREEDQHLIGQFINQRNQCV